MREQQIGWLHCVHFAALAAAIVIGLTLWALVAVRRADGDMLQLSRFSLVLAATLIVSPVVWDH